MEYSATMRHKRQAVPLKVPSLAMFPYTFRAARLFYINWARTAMFIHACALASSCAALTHYTLLFIFFLAIHRVDGGCYTSTGIPLRSLCRFVWFRDVDPQRKDSDNLNTSVCQVVAESNVHGFNIINEALLPRRLRKH